MTALRFGYGSCWVSDYTFNRGMLGMLTQTKFNYQPTEKKFACNWKKQTNKRTITKRAKVTNNELPFAQCFEASHPSQGEVDFIRILNQFLVVSFQRLLPVMEFFVPALLNFLLDNIPVLSNHHKKVVQIKWAVSINTFKLLTTSAPWFFIA